MITKPKPAHALLPGFLLAACVALPGGSAAQSATSTKGPGTLGAAMAEALRSPFHARTGAGGLAIFQPSGVPVPHAGDRQVRDSARGPSFRRVFWPTLGAVVLSDLAAIALVYSCLDSDRSSCNGAGLVSVGTAVLVPATVAWIAGGSFAKGTLGSAVGFGLGFWFLVLGQESAAWWALPITHSLVTTALSRLPARAP